MWEHKCEITFFTNINLIDLSGYLFMLHGISLYWESQHTSLVIGSPFVQSDTKKVSFSINIRNSQFIKKTGTSLGNIMMGLLWTWLALLITHAHSHMILLWVWADCLTVLSAGFLSYKTGTRLTTLHIVFVVQNSTIMQV